MTGPTFDRTLDRDQTSVLGFRNRAGESVLLAGSSNYEDGQTNGSLVRQYNLAAQKIEDTFPGSEFNTGPLAMTDMNGDGQLNLFVGGRVIPGRYPEAPPSLLFARTNDMWVVDVENTKALQKAG
jgi:hypothetical protein